MNQQPLIVHSMGLYFIKTEHFQSEVNIMHDTRITRC